VPSTKEWNDIYTALGLSDDDPESVDTLRTEFYLPFAGYRYYSSAGVDYQGTYGFYWSSSRSNANIAYNLLFDSSALNPQDYYGRALGFSVRCLKNSPR
jgi:uncharacterized protein (TIGR02145 family)